MSGIEIGLCVFMLFCTLFGFYGLYQEIKENKEFNTNKEVKEKNECKE